MHKGSAIALVGMSCRVPGGSDPRALWRLLESGSSAISETPAARIPPGSTLAELAPGAQYGGFLERVDQFDCSFFGISPREAAVTDPQQRLMLELCWEALEDAALVPGELRGSSAGVFVGTMASEYAELLREAGPDRLTQHAQTGLQRSLIANRVSYTLCLRGPSITIDTGQSSSLVAVHMACESLRRGESTLALAGGVHLNLSAAGLQRAASFGGLSRDGRCAAFDAKANGYVRGEGGAVVVLRPLADALRAGDPIHCVIHGTAVNNDGGGEALAAPSQAAQEELLRAAYRRAGVRRSDVQYVEAHGTGTVIGDHVEASALGALLGTSRMGSGPLAIGSIKTNVGHLEGAAGVVGLVKVALCMEHRQLVPSLNFSAARDDLPLEELGLTVQCSLGSWPQSERTLCAGVSSVGLGGTNCHVVVGERPDVEAVRHPARRAGIAAEEPFASQPQALPLSARSDLALRTHAASLANWIGADAQLAVDEVACTLACGRTSFNRRAIVLGEDRESLLAGLQAVAAGEPAENAIEGVSPHNSERDVVLVFSGQGGEWEGMAAGLLAASPTFAKAMAECETALARHVDWSLRDLINGAKGAPGLDRLDALQPALFAVMVSLAKLWQACGVRPAAVVGHSQGEIAAAHIAGGLSLDDAAKVVAVRSKALTRLVGRGALMSVALSAGEMEQRLERWNGRVVIAAVNGPGTVVVSGELQALAELSEECKEHGVRTRRIAGTKRSPHMAAHSPQVEELHDGVIDAWTSVAPQEGDLPLYSTVTGGPIGTGQLDGHHWYRNMREPVLFEAALRALHRDGLRTFIEIGPHPVLATGMQEAFERWENEDGTLTVLPEAIALGSLRRDDGGPQDFMRSLAEAWTQGVAVDWPAALALKHARRTRLPTYPFQRRRHWLGDPVGAPAVSGPAEGWSSDGELVEGGVAASEPIESELAEKELAEREVAKSELAQGGQAEGALLSRRLGAAPAADQGRIVLEEVCAQVAVICGERSADDIEPAATFKELGLDSRGAIALCKRLRTVSGLSLKTALLFDHPSPAALATHLRERLTDPTESDVGMPGRRQVARSASQEPIAIVGMSCRLPGGVSSPEELWELVAAGADAISDFPADRGWDLETLYDSDPDRPGAVYARGGGFLYDAGDFDAAFFGISPSEALAMDPQQRLMLEACWEAVEDAGIDPLALGGSATGVFAGGSIYDYNAACWLMPDMEIESLTGSAVSVISGRVAYALDLEGPTLTVDAACSSSLVALHLACAALRSGECSLALAGGATVMATPSLFVAFSGQRALAGDGRCKSFADAADGTGWGEGVGVLLLERLKDARENGHEVLAVVRGSAVNQDGRSNGLTAPNGLAQREVIRRALATAQLRPEEVDAVEGHGTGTRLGDPIEAAALLATYGRRPASRPLRIGSIKSNIGHTQAAAGVAGVIKMTMAMRHGVLPQTLHVDRPSGEVDWSSGAVALLTEQLPWSAAGRPLRAGVSSFGISGTNAHVILEQAPQQKVPAVANETLPDTPVPWVLSGRSPQALCAQAARLRAHLLDTPQLRLQDVALSLAHRSVFEHRAVLVAARGEDLLSGLAQLSDASVASTPAICLTRGVAAQGRTALLFTGQGAQRVGMGRELYEAFPAFKDAFDVACAHLDEVLDSSLRTVVFGDGKASSSGEAMLDRTQFTQAGLFALEVALFALLHSWGVIPDFLIGHSVGELAAAHAAGVFSLKDACKLVGARGRLMGELPEGGAMVAVQASEEEARRWVAGYGERLALAAVNGPCAVVLSGAQEAVIESEQAWREQGRKTKRLRVSHAFHSPLVDEMLADFRQVAESISFNEPEIAIVSNLTGRQVEAKELVKADYWVRHARETVRFADGVRWLERQGVTRFLELGPDGVLSAAVGDCLSDEQAGERAPATAVPLLSAGRPEPATLLQGLAESWVAGATVDWRLLGPADARRVKLPTYAFQRERYWRDVPGWQRLRTDAPSPGVETDSCRYQVEWKPIRLDAAGGTPGRWLMLLPAEGSHASLAREILTALRAGGTEVDVIKLPEDALHRDQLARQLRAAVEDALPDRQAGEPPASPEARPAAKLSGVISLLALEEEGDGERVSARSGLAATLELSQAMASAELAAPLWIVTQGAVSTGVSDRLVHPLQGMTWGLGRVVGLERPDRWGGLVDLPPEVDRRSIERLCAVLGDGSEAEVAVRGAGVFARRLVRAPGKAASATSERTSASRDGWDAAGTVLITGGTGALGGSLARLLAREGARHILLASRGGPEADGAQELEGELLAAGAEVSIVACDVADRAQLEALLEGVPREHPLSAIFHVAGIVDATLIEELTVERLLAVLRAKVEGARHLHELTRHADLREFVMFSSIAAVLGSWGQGSYAAANAFLDALAEHRGAEGLPARSIAWGPWSGGGMAEGNEQWLLNQGVLQMAPDEALAALWHELDRDEGCVILARVDWKRYAAAHTVARPRPLLANLLTAGGMHAKAPAAQADDLLVARLSGLSDRERQQALVDLVRTEAAAVLGHASSEPIASKRPFKELGFNSVKAVELRRRLQQTTGLRLPFTVVFDHPSPARLAEHLLTVMSDTSPKTTVMASTIKRSEDPVAIVAIGCRFPGGVTGPEDLWRLVRGGVDAIGPFPDDRGWDLERLYDPDPDRLGASYVREGGFVLDAVEFDAALFGIAPNEALAMDPQQRLFLEVCWEAIERAGIDPRSLHGSDAGVFAGSNPSVYGFDLPDMLERFEITAGVSSVVSGRVAYALGLEGPAISVDTACSSSLVALHLACGALRSGECGMALAGGVTVMATPNTFVSFSRQRGVAPDGRCKAFADAADGTAWAEGAGVLVLERLADARRAGHPVLALVSGSAINQDGASNGLTAPNGPAQERVIRQALANAGLSADQVQAVEGHGTGTRLGDPIEAQALLGTYGRQRREGEPLWLGSVKSNIGHTQAASGVAGVIKMVMAMRAGVLPRTLHIDRPTERVDWSQGAVALLSQERAWDFGGQPRRAGVSTFGVSGTNAHVVLEQSPAEDAPGDQRADLGPVAWPLSGESEAALGAQAQRLCEWLQEHRDASIAEVGFALQRRAAMERRAVIVGESREQLLAGLGLLAEGLEHASVVEGGRMPEEARVAFMFSGQGAQRAGMGRELYERFSVFRDAIDDVCAGFERLLDHPLRETMFATEGSPDASRLDGTELAQPALFALEVALFRLVESFGLRPDFVTGHSIGELVAAHVAGALSLRDACALVHARGQLMGALPRGGAMVAVQASEGEAAASIIGLENRVAIAAVNGPEAVVISGDEPAVLAVAAAWERQGRRISRLRVSHAFHSPYIEAMLDDFRSVATGICFQEPQIPIVSNLTGEAISAPELCAPEHWVRHVRQTVRFADGIRWLRAQGVAGFLELGPDGVLASMAEATLAPAEDGPASQPAVVVTSALRRDRPEATTLLGALGCVWAHGAECDWQAAFEGPAPGRVELPTYAFQRQRYWLSKRAGEAGASSPYVAGHPLLDTEVALAGEQGWLFTGSLSLESQGWLGDHVVLDRTLLPGTALLDLVLYVGLRLGCAFVRELTLQAPLVLGAGETIELQIAVSDADSAGIRALSVHARPRRSARAAENHHAAADWEEPGWVCHATGELAPVSAADEATLGGSLVGQLGGPPGGELGGQLVSELEVWPPARAERIDIERLYADLADAGLEYGPAFQLLTAAWRRDGELFAEARLPEPEAQQSGFMVHPALLDAALHATALAGPLPGSPNASGVRLPFCWREVRAPLAEAQTLRVRMLPAADGSISIFAADEQGRAVVVAGALETRAASAADLDRQARDGDGLLRLDWVAAPTPPPPSQEERWEVLDCAQPRSQEQLPGEVHTRAAQALETVQKWLEDERSGARGLAIVTCGAVSTSAGEDVRDLPAAAIWGLVRSAQVESPGRLRLIDLDEAPSSREALALALASEEPQLAIRGGALLAARIAPGGPGGLLVPPCGAAQWRLDVTEPGTVEGLSAIAAEHADSSLQPGQVRVRMRAAGLNFKDVMIALGAYPGDAVIGGEGAGTVLAVGPGVEALAPGDRVMGLFSGAFGPVAVTDAQVLAPIPDGWSFAQAATVPIAFLTAYYALVDLAGLRPNERLLVHSAAGGVGTAALRLARQLGAESFGTASAGKWEWLAREGIGADHLASSREVSFAERLLELTGGEGMDVVLGSLAGEQVDASLRLLPRGGRFLEMGKTDVRDPAQVAAQFKGVAYRAFDLMDAGEERIQEMLRALIELFEGEAIKPLHLRAWDMRRAPEALRFMSQARHVGKLVLIPPAPTLDRDGTVLITGGTGGLGALLARHLVSVHGVRSLLLASRAGEAAPGVQQLCDQLSELGATVRIAACDIADRDQVVALFGSVPRDLPLQGVVHAAGVLDDGMVGSITAERLDAVLAPKVDGAWHLHQLTRELDLRAFVLFSSIAGTLGAAGQAGYAAANAFLDALAAHRRAEGLSASSIAWGPWQPDAGMTAQLTESDMARFASGGLGLLMPEQGLALFDRALDSADAATVAAKLDLAALRARDGDQEQSMIFERFTRARSRPKRRDAASGALARALLGLPRQEQMRILLEAVRTHTAAVLGYPSAEAIDTSRSFKELGIDSLAAVELRNRLAGALNMQLPAGLIFDHPSSLALAEHLLDRVSDTGAEQSRTVSLALDRLHPALVAISAQDARRTGIASRLRQILNTWEESALEDVVEQEIASGSDEELFTLIDEGLGVSE